MDEMERVEKVLNAIRSHFDMLDGEDFESDFEELLCCADEIGLALNEIQ